MFGIKLSKNQMLTAVAVFVAILLFGAITYAAGNINLDNSRQLDGMIDVINTVFMWVTVLTSIGAVIFVLVREGAEAANKKLEETVISLETSPLFDKMDEDFDKLPPAIQKMVTDAATLLETFNVGLLHSDGISAMKRLVDNLADVDEPAT